MSKVVSKRKNFKKSKAGPGQEKKPGCPALSTPADILTSFHARASDAIDVLGEEAAMKPINVSYIVSDRQGFFPLDVTFGGYVMMFCSRHPEQSQKEMNGTVWGEMPGHRADKQVTAVYALSYDCDDTISLPEFDAALDKFGAAGVAWTTYNHGRTVTKIIDKHRVALMNSRGPRIATPLTDKEAREFCAATKKYATLKNVRVRAEGVLQDATTADPFYLIEHDPLVKFRAVLLLKEPIPLSEVGQDGYRALYCSIGDTIFGAGNYDPACKNPSRIQWNPAKPTGSNVEHKVLAYRGELLDWRPTWEKLKVRIEKERAAAEAEAEARMKARENGNGDLYDVVQCLAHIPACCSYDVWIKVLGAIHNESGGSEDGRKLAHAWSAKCPTEYSPETIDDLWDYFESGGSGRKAGIGSLIMLAQERCKNFMLKPMPMPILNPRNFKKMW